MRKLFTGVALVAGSILSFKANATIMVAGASMMSGIMDGTRIINCAGRGGLCVDITGARVQVYEWGRMSYAGELLSPPDVTEEPDGTVILNAPLHIRPIDMPIAVEEE